MNKPKQHILVCASMRMNGEPMGTCHKKNGANLLQYLETEIADRGLSDFIVSSTGCLKMCGQGPVLVVYPQGHWYGNIDEPALAEILDALEAGQVAEKYLLG